MKKPRSLLVLFGLLLFLSNTTFADEFNSFDRKIMGHWKGDGKILDWIFGTDGRFVLTMPMRRISGNFKVSYDGGSVTLSHRKDERFLFSTQPITTQSLPAEAAQLYWEDDNLLNVTMNMEQTIESVSISLPATMVISRVITQQSEAEAEAKRQAEAAAEAERQAEAQRQAEAEASEDAAEAERQAEAQRQAEASEDAAEAERQAEAQTEAAAEAERQAELQRQIEAETDAARQAKAEYEAELQQPSVQVGDSYTYQSTDELDPKSSSITKRTVIATGNGIVLSSLVLNKKKAKPRKHYYDSEWGLINTRNSDKGGKDYTPPLKYFSFPLFPGKTWQQVSTETDIKTGKTRIHTITGTVGEWEWVTVPAGTFNAIKVSLDTKLFDPNTGETTNGTDTSWYAPEIRRSVQSIMTGDGKQVIQLIKYELNAE